MKYVEVSGCNAEYHKQNYGSNAVKTWFHQKPLKLISKELITVKKSDALEIGCASGIFLPTLCSTFTNVTGLDISDDYFKDIEKMDLKNLKLVKKDAKEMDFKDNSFDFVSCLETLEHVIDPSAVLAQIKRVLRPGGILIVSVPIEIGTTLLIKYLGRLLLGYGPRYAYEYPIPEMLRSFAKKPDKEAHRTTLGHKNFDYRDVVDGIIKNGFIIEKKKYFPFNILGSEFNTRIIIVAVNSK